MLNCLNCLSFKLEVLYDNNIGQIFQPTSKRHSDVAYGNFGMDVSRCVLFLPVLAFWQFVLRASYCHTFNCVIVLFETVEAFIC